MVAGSMAASLAGPVVPIEAPFAAGWGLARRRLGPGDGSRGRGVPGAVSPLALIPGRSVEGSRDGVDLGRGAP